jgi:hypothetical protein
LVVVEQQLVQVLERLLGLVLRQLEQRRLLVLVLLGLLVAFFFYYIFFTLKCSIIQ